MQVELQDGASGAAFPGFSLADCVPIIVDSVNTTVIWKPHVGWQEAELGRISATEPSYRCASTAPDGWSAAVCTAVSAMNRRCWILVDCMINRNAFVLLTVCPARKESKLRGGHTPCPPASRPLPDLQQGQPMHRCTHCATSTGDVSCYQG